MRPVRCATVRVQAECECSLLPLVRNCASAGDEARKSLDIVRAEGARLRRELEELRTSVKQHHEKTESAIKAVTTQNASLPLHDVTSAMNWDFTTAKLRVVEHLFVRDLMDSSASSSGVDGLWMKPCPTPAISLRRWEAPGLSKVISSVRS